MIRLWLSANKLDRLKIGIVGIQTAPNGEHADSDDDNNGKDIARNICLLSSSFDLP